LKLKFEFKFFKFKFEFFKFKFRFNLKLVVLVVLPPRASESLLVVVTRSRPGLRLPVWLRERRMHWHIQVDKSVNIKGLRTSC
jgi:hypothetical protein